MQARRTVQWNGPTGRLVDDILEVIFYLHVMEVYSQPAKDANEVLKLSHVCGWWRDIALASPRLWSYIDVCQPRLSREFLNRRGKSGPIAFVSSLGQQLPSLPDFEDLLRFADRVRHINVALIPANMRLFIYRMRPFFGNILTLHLIQTSAGGALEEIHMNHKLPSLTQLSLDGVTMDWNTKFNLTHLVLCRLHGPKAPSMAELQLILMKNPRLEKICLDRVFLMPSDLPRDTLKLPRLRLLMLSMTPSSAGRIISGLLIPPSAQLKIKLWEDNGQLTTVFRAYKGQPHPFIAITNDSTLSLRPRKIVVRQSESHPFSDYDVPLSIELPQNTSVTIFPTLSTVFDILRLTTLELDFMHPDFLRAEAVQESLAVTRKFLESALNLLTLRVCQALAAIVADVLGENTSFPKPICPGLIWLSFGDPHQMWWDFPTAINGDIAGGWLQPIVMCLQARHALTRSKLETIEFVGVGHINRDAIGLLFHVVNNIINSVLCPTSPPCMICSIGPRHCAGWRFP
jgi:hypothetical protein